MKSRSDFSVHVEPRCLAGSDLQQPWAVIRRAGNIVWQFGPYRSEREARSKARFRLAQHYSGSHRLPTVDQTPIGPQYVLPGAERAGSAELAKRKAAAPMRPSVPQKPCDHGLFDDTQTQIDLEEMLG